MSSMSDAASRLMDVDEAAARGGPTTLYRLYDEMDALLYVGIAGNPGRRFEQHRTDKPWWGDVATIKTRHFKDRVAAMEAERDAIQAEHPLHNIAPGEAVTRDPRDHRRFVVGPPRSGRRRTSSVSRWFTPGRAPGLGSRRGPGNHVSCEDPDRCDCWCHPEPDCGCGCHA